jgi:hypothetical protein
MNFNKPEALSWLQTNSNLSPFASNRFDKQGAIDFVKRLYELGCRQVAVANLSDEEWRIAKEGGPYADTLIAVLPTDRDQRCLIFGLYNEERATERLPPEEEDDREELEFWWD